MTTLFLFAHQDDEIGVFHALNAAKKRGERLSCVFLTDGVWKGVTSARRNAESKKCLTKLGLTPSEMTFLGTSAAVPNGLLVEHLQHCFDSLCQHVVQLALDGQPVSRVIMHAWEGGHHDHDAVHIIGLALAKKFGLLEQSRQFPLYRNPSGRWTMTFATPLASNGAVESISIPISQRLKYLGLLASYGSQKRVILQLFPHIANHYVRAGAQRLQQLSLERVYSEPNTPPMLYEKWKLYSYARFRQHADPFIARHLPLAPHAQEKSA